MRRKAYLVGKNEQNLCLNGESVLKDSPKDAHKLLSKYFCLVIYRDQT